MTNEIEFYKTRCIDLSNALQAMISVAEALSSQLPELHTIADIAVVTLERHYKLVNGREESGLNWAEQTLKEIQK